MPSSPRRRRPPPPPRSSALRTRKSAAGRRGADSSWILGEKGRKKRTGKQKKRGKEREKKPTTPKRTTHACSEWKGGLCPLVSYEGEVGRALHGSVVPMGAAGGRSPGTKRTTKVSGLSALLLALAFALRCGAQNPASFLWNFFFLFLSFFSLIFFFFWSFRSVFSAAFGPVSLSPGSAGPEISGALGWGADGGGAQGRGLASPAGNESPAVGSSKEETQRAPPQHRWWSGAAGGVRRSRGPPYIQCLSAVLWLRRARGPRLWQWQCKYTFPT